MAEIAVKPKLEGRVYLPGLSALRFFAAFSVMVGHIEMLKSNLGLNNAYEFVARVNFGGLGVYFFFVLSGFLITFLLIHEKEQKGFINIRKFYIRRILRIWPLYYLITFLSLFVFPQFEMLHIPWFQQFFDQDWWANFTLFMIMLPNVAFSFMSALPHGGQLWSIGVEEQFYLLWPVLFSKTKNLLRLILVGIVVLIGVKILTIISLRIGFIPTNDWTLGVKKLIAMSKFECMLIGALGAVFVKDNYFKILKVVYHPITQVVTLFIVPFLSYFYPSSIDDTVHLPYAILFLFIILNISTNPKSILKLEHPIFDFLGKISYGLYMYHMVLVVFIVQSSKQLFILNSWAMNIFIYLGTLLLSVLVAWLSYEYFEKPFLKLKERFTIVRSGKA